MTDQDDECEMVYWLRKPFWGRGTQYRNDQNGFHVYIRLKDYNTQFYTFVPCPGYKSCKQVIEAAVKF